MLWPKGGMTVLGLTGRGAGADGAGLCRALTASVSRAFVEAATTGLAEGTGLGGADCPVSVPSYVGRGPGLIFVASNNGERLAAMGDTMGLAGREGCERPGERRGDASLVSVPSAGECATVGTASDRDGFSAGERAVPPFAVARLVGGDAALPGETSRFPGPLSLSVGGDADAADGAGDSEAAVGAGEADLLPALEPGARFGRGFDRRVPPDVRPCVRGPPLGGLACTRDWTPAVGIELGSGSGVFALLVLAFLLAGCGTCRLLVLLPVALAVVLATSCFRLDVLISDVDDADRSSDETDEARDEDAVDDSVGGFCGRAAAGAAALGAPATFALLPDLSVLATAGIALGKATASDLVGETRLAKGMTSSISSSELLALARSSSSMRCFGGGYFGSWVGGVSKLTSSACVSKGRCADALVAEVEVDA